MQDKGDPKRGRPDLLEDRIDLTLAAELAANARLTLAQLSAKTGLSTSAVQTRVRRLESRNVIQGYRALLDPAEVGKPTAAFIEVTPVDLARPDDTPEQLEHLPEIEACYSVAGDTSYMLLVRVANPTDLEELIRQIRAKAGVSTRTTVVLHTYFEDRPILSLDES